MNLDMQFASDFRRADVQHLVTVAVSGAVMLGVCLFGRAWTGSARELWIRRSWTVALVVCHLTSFALALLRSFDPYWSLPLHLCNLAVVPATLALWNEFRWSQTLTYFWALGLSTQAFLTPILTQGPQTLAFWLFWGDHTTLVGAACYVVWVRGYRPRLRDAVLAFAATAAYAAIILPIDLIFDWNYGFLGPQDLPGTLIELLPPWPLRVLVLLGLVGVWFFLMWRVWPQRSLPEDAPRRVP
jgi:hypothetical integral membrane protein (TIGR02206 family)